MTPSLEDVYNELLKIRSMLEKSQPLRQMPLSERSMLSRLNISQIKTYLKIEAGKEYTAADIAKMTWNARAHESSVLNQLVRLGVLERRKHGKTVYFKRRADEDAEAANIAVIPQK